MKHLIFLPLLIFLGAFSAFGTTITVTNGSDTGAGSLRNAIVASASGDIIQFSGVTTVTLTSGELLIDNNLTINGGSGVTVTRSGGTQFRIFNITSGTVAALNNLTITNGNTTFGGGVFNSGTLTMNTCQVSGNTSTQGGGIQNDATITLINCGIFSNTVPSPGEGGGIATFGPSCTLTGCTVSNNSASFYDGIFASANNMTFTMTNCTISGNPGNGVIYDNPNGPTANITNCTFTNNTWGLALFTGSVLLKNNIIADNNSSDIYNNTGGYFGTVSSSSSFNLIGTSGNGGLVNGVNNNQVGVVNPGLVALASNGGPTQTHALSPCSPAINTGTNSGAPSTDQRGSPRPFGGTGDIGAYELQSAPTNMSVSASVTNLLCNGVSNGSIDLTITNGTSPYTYAWTGSGSGGDPRINLAAGTYTVTVTSAAGCTATTSATVTQPAVIAITNAVTNVLCNGASTGSIDLTVSGGTGAYSYNWSGAGSGTDPRTNLAAGTYTVTVTDANNCAKTNTATVTQPTLIAVTGAVTNVLCNGASTGSINLTVTGGTGAYSYAWTGTGTGTDPRTNLAAGTYTVTVTDANNCTKTNSFSVTEPAAITVTPSVTNATCGNSNGSISLNVTGGAGSYTYAWTGTGTGSNPRTNLAAGTYTVTVMDVSNCTNTSSATVVAPDVTPPSITCPAAQNLSANASCLGPLPDYTSLASASDNCTANPSITQSPNAGTTFSLGSHIVTLTATDASNNTATCSMNVSVNDQTAPNITCPANTTVAANASCNASLASYTAAATATDNCTANPAKTQSPAAATVITGTQIVTLTATDATSNTKTCTFTVTVADQTAPSITCPANTTVTAGAGCTASLASYTAAATASDNCTANPTKMQSPAAATVITGSQIVTLTATDGANNTATCSFTVSVADQTPPTISCPANTTVAAGAGCTASLASYTAAATASDNCTASPAKTQSPAAATVITGSQIVTLTATDGANNTATCSFTVSVADQTAPTISCPANTTVAAGAACTASLASYTAAATASDNCTANPTKTQSPAAATVITGSQIVTLTATDGANNTATCSFTVSVTDQTPPSITCPTNTSVSADVNGNYTLASFTGAATASDNCTANPAKTQNPIAGTVLTVGMQIITLTATDGASLTASCTFTLTVQPGCAAPTVSCPANTVVAAGASCTAILANFSGATTVTGGCGASTLSQSPVSGTVLNLGNQIVTFTATDNNNDTGTCTFTVTVADQTAPTITCPANATVPAGAGCTASLASYTAAATASDNCTANPTKTQSPAAATVITGSQIVTLTATDAASNSAACTFTVTVADQTAPTITCPANATVPAGAACTASLASYTAAATASDNCTANPAKTQSPAVATVITGSQIVTLTATDGANNTATCSFTVSVIDQTAPTITCPANATVPAGAACTASLASYTAAATASDNCTANPAKTQSPVAGTVITGTQIIVLTATDGAANSANCSFSVTVTDQTAPTITCPANTTVAAGAACTATLASYTAAATASDNCTASPTKTQSPVAGTILNIGSQVITLTATDAASNSANCSFSVTVADQTAPTITCPANITVAPGANCTAILANYTGSATATDNCTASPTKTQTPAAGTTFGLGNQTITLTATDAAGNSSNCSFQLSIVDITPPTMICQNISVNLNAAGTATITTAQVNNGSFDNCGINVIFLTQTTFTCANIGPNQVLLNGVDLSNNKGVCAATVTVVDAIAPTALCKNGTVQVGATGSVAIPASSINNGSSDNCSFSLTVTPSTLTCANVGINIVTLKATDASGNTATCSAVVTVQDKTAPVALCKNINVFLNSNGQASITPADINNGSNDPCGIASMSINQNQFYCGDLQGSSISVQLTVKDINNNTSTCISQVTVKDNIAPTAICANTTVQLNTQGKATVYGATLAAGSTDNCSVWSYSPVAKVYTAANLGVNNLAITVKDYSNNASTCVSQVTVVPYGAQLPQNMVINTTETDEDVAESQEVVLQSAVTERTSGTVDMELNVYPNPADQAILISFQLPKDQQFSLRMFNMAGKLVFQTAKDGFEGENSLPIDLNDLQSGLYIIDIQSGTGREQKRLVIQR